MKELHVYWCIGFIITEEWCVWIIILKNTKKHGRFKKGALPWYQQRLDCNSIRILRYIPIHRILPCCLLYGRMIYRFFNYGDQSFLAFDIIRQNKGSIIHSARKTMHRAYASLHFPPVPLNVTHMIVIYFMCIVRCWWVKRANTRKIITRNHAIR